MERRHFVAGLGAGTYSLIVSAEDLVGQNSTGSGSETTQVATATTGRKPATAADANAATVPSEDNMHLQEHTCDVLVAGGGPAGVLHPDRDPHPRLLEEVAAVSFFGRDGLLARVLPGRRGPRPPRRRSTARRRRPAAGASASTKVCFLC